MTKRIALLSAVAAVMQLWPMQDRVAAAEPNLLRGLVGYLALDEDLAIVSPEGTELTAEFARHSRAFDDELQCFEPNEPRFVPGRFGSAIVVESGYESRDKFAARNYLPPALAQLRVGRGEDLPYAPTGDAALAVRARTDHVDGAPGALSRCTGFLAVTCAASGAGAQTRDGVELIPGNYTLSFFAVGTAAAPTLGRFTEPDLALGRRSKHGPLLEGSDGLEDTIESVQVEVMTEGGQSLVADELTLTRQWQRLQVTFSTGTFTRDKDKQTARPYKLRFMGTRPGQAFLLGGLVLEMNGGYSYAGTRGMTSWLPGHGYRASESLDLSALRYAVSGERGSVSFWACTQGLGQTWRTLFELAGTNRWQPHLQLTLRPNTRLYLHGGEATRVEATAAVTIEPGAWHHYAVTWSDGTAVAYVDGHEAARVTGLTLPAVPPRIRLGSSGPNAPSGAAVDEAAFYGLALTSAAIEALAARAEPLSAATWPPVSVRPMRFIRTIAHTLEPQPWGLTVVNHDTGPQEGLQVRFRLGETIDLSKPVPRLVARGESPLTFRFVANLQLGTYPLSVSVVKDDQIIAGFECEVEITPMAEPSDNLQVSPWGINADRAYGLTFGGGDLEDAMRRGLYWAPHNLYLCYPRAVDGEDWIYGMNDTLFRPSFTSPYIQRQIEAEAERLSQQYAGIPAMRTVSLSSEQQWLWHHDFSPSRIEWVKATFGLDLERWHYPPEKGGVNAFQAPFGRLRPSAAGIELPPDRVIDLSTPIYAYHRWFHGPDGVTETYMNQRLSDAIHRRRPDILTVQEPILRRAAVRAFDRMSIAQEWFYYEDPMGTVMVQERLNAAVRGTPMRPTGMPQFLFKAGGAAPYNSIATADMYHETVWLCALQPIRMFTYWNFGVVPNAEYENPYHTCMTKAEIDAFFDTPTPTWEQAKAVLQDKPTIARKLMPWTPELIATFKRFHTQEVGPLGALIPHWRNRPRRIAILRSFANQLYNEVRWPRSTWLENCVVYSGMPFDVLYDSDLESDSEPLASYQLVVVSRAVCLTRPTFERLSAFSSRGGTIVVDPETKVELPGAVVLEPTASFEAFGKALWAKEEELLGRYGSVSHPLYVESMTQLAEASELPNAVDPAVLRLLEEKVDPEARSLTPNTWLNLLTADGANYIGVVNNLRVRGPMYGHFGKVRETGVPQTAEVVFEPELGSAVYDLLSHERLDVNARGDRISFMLSLPGCGARVVMLLPRPIAELTARAEFAPARWGARDGLELCVEARLTDDQGDAVAGRVPASVEVRRPDGSRSDFSRHAAFRRGRLSYRFPVPANTASGRWRVRVLERASGRVAELELDSEPSASSSCWPSFRGPGAGGVRANSRPPLVWDVQSGKNIRWQTEIPGLAHSSPVVWGDRVFVTTAVAVAGDAELKVGLYGDIEPVPDEGQHEWRLYCLDARTGEVLWERVVDRAVPKTKRHPKASHANCTPAVDGRHVVAFFGSEGLYCFDLEGVRVWHRDLGVLDSGFFRVRKAQWGFASSPVIHGSKVLVQCDVQDSSFLAAFDVETGGELWRTPRDEVPTWSTPTVVSAAGRTQVAVNGYRHIGGYDIETGAELWRLRGGGDIPVPTPVAAHGLVFIANAHGSLAPMYAVRADALGDITPGTAASATYLAWMNARNGAYMQTPVVVGDFLYSCTDRGVLNCYRAATGEAMYRQRMGTGHGYTASPVAASDRLYFTSEKGRVHVIAAGAEFVQLAANEMGETCMATPAIAGDVLIFRTRTHVVAVGETGE